jgi:alpha-L-fucosidase
MNTRFTLIPLLLLCATWCAAQEPWNPTVALSESDDMDTLLQKAVAVRPSARQWAWHQAEFSCFVHFGVNTFTDREWGDGTEDPALFNPTEFDAKQWVAACKAAGIRKLILTAKHHDGFCLWPSAYTEHSVKNSPWKKGQGDMVREVAEACREGGLLFAVYLSPWDRHEPSYGDSPKYNQYFLNQLRELLTNYGPVAEVWFDGACAEGPNGKRQVYDWDAYFGLIRELQPEACISIMGPDVRWCGNEAGKTRESEWSVIPTGANAQEDDLGSRAQLLAAAKVGASLRWHPSQVNTSIRPGWFYHPNQDGRVKSLDHLLDVYYGSVGGNAEFLLNIPPDRRGRFHENDVQRLRELGGVLKATYDENLLADAEGIPAALVDGDTESHWENENEETLEIDLGALVTFNRALLQEYLPQGQRVERHAVDIWDGQAWKTVAENTVIGYKRLLRFPEVTAQRVRLRITESRAKPILSEVGLYYAPPLLLPPAITRDEQGNVALGAAPGAEIRYWLSHWPVESGSKRYTAPFPLPEGGMVKAVVIPPDDADFADIGQSHFAEAEFGLAKTDWRIESGPSKADKAHPGAMAIDEDPQSYWQSKRSPGAMALIIDLGGEYAITGFSYLARQNEAKGRATDYRFQVGADPKTWGDAVAEGAFDNIENNPNQRIIRLENAVTGRYVRFEATAVLQGVSYATAAEIGVLVVSDAGKNNPAPPALDKQAWWQAEKDAPLETPTHANPALPLSDQENHGQWTPYPPMSDEFEGPFDSTKWWNHNPTWLGRKPGFFHPNNVAIREGKLELTMRHEEPPAEQKRNGFHTFTAAAVQSKDTVRYGYFEVKAKAMASGGSSSFWFYKSNPPWWTEIDVFELCGGNPKFNKKMHMNLHVLNSPLEKKHQSVSGAHENTEGVAEAYHVYGLDWDEAEIKLYFDGALVRRGPNTHWHQPLTLNFDSETMPEWFGLPDPNDLPSPYSIEYVRAWKK